MQKVFYKIVDNKAQVGSGTFVPEDFIEYEIGNEPEELLLALEVEDLENKLQIKINEAKEFLSKTDKKILPYYEFEKGDNTLEWYVEERNKARTFIRSNT